MKVNDLDKKLSADIEEFHKMITRKYKPLNADKIYYDRIPEIFVDIEKLMDNFRKDIVQFLESKEH